MTTWDKHTGGGQRPQQRRKTPSFSSSLLDAICHSIDESREGGLKQDFNRTRENNAVEIEIEEQSTSLRKAIMIDKWMENHTKYNWKSTHFNSDSTSSTESSLFSSSETDSASKSTPKSLNFIDQKPKLAHTLYSEISQKASKSCETIPKSRALKTYGDMKKAKQPISPGSKIASFLNSIFNSSRNVKKHHHHNHHQADEKNWSSSVRKSRSVKDHSTTCSFTSRSCLSKAPTSRNKSKRSVRFAEDYPFRGHKTIYDNDLVVGSRFIKENINGIQRFEEIKSEKYVLRRSFNHESEEDEDDDDRSCTSSDLFELENIGLHREELPVYGTTNLKINQAIANGLVM